MRGRRRGGKRHRWKKHGRGEINLRPRRKEVGFVSCPWAVGRVGGWRSERGLGGVSRGLARVTAQRSG